MKVHRQTVVTAAMVIAAAIDIASSVVAATPISADHSAFSTLSSESKGARTPGPCDQPDAVSRGIRDGYQAWDRAHLPRDDSATHS